VYVVDAPWQGVGDRRQCDDIGRPRQQELPAVVARIEAGLGTWQMRSEMPGDRARPRYRRGVQTNVEDDSKTGEIEAFAVL
jgi:hypothetical protein